MILVFDYCCPTHRYTSIISSTNILRAAGEVGGTESSPEMKESERLQTVFAGLARRRVSRSKLFRQVAAGVGQTILANHGTPLRQSGGSTPCLQ